MKIRILQHKASTGAKRLAEALSESGHDAKRLKVRGSKYRGVEGHLLINWGSSDRRTIREGISMLNEPHACEAASNKIETFRNLPVGVGVDWTTSRDEAVEWVQSGETVFCRTLTRGTQGRGIVVAHTQEEIVDAPLYTKGFATDREVRVHVANGTVIDFVQKKKMSSERRENEGIEEVNMEVRNHDNGWIFAREGVEIPNQAREKAIQAVQSLGLFFGAVDISINQQGEARVLEVNTAPGLEGTTVESYKNAFLNYIESL